MLTQEARERIYHHAYIPEHLPDYVTAVSGTEAHLVGDCVCFTGKDRLIFIGYPLGSAEGHPADAYEAACDRFQPAIVSIVAPKLWFSKGGIETGEPDQYYRLFLPLEKVRPDVAYMVRRARRELRVTEGEFGKAHQKIIDAFVSRRHLPEAQRHIFKHIPAYLKQAKTFRVLEAWREKTLVAFTIIDFGAARYAFYLFNFRSGRIHVPGSSDLLFQEMVDLAQKEGKPVLNLGLGVHPGIRRFKEKWGGAPFLDHRAAVVERTPRGLESLAKKL